MVRLTGAARRLTAVASPFGWDVVPRRLRRAVARSARVGTWFQTILAVAGAVCVPRGRIRFWNPGKVYGSPLQGQAIAYLGDDVDRFRQEFGVFGTDVVARRLKLSTDGATE